MCHLAAYVCRILRGYAEKPQSQRQNRLVYLRERKDNYKNSQGKHDMVWSKTFRLRYVIPSATLSISISLHIYLKIFCFCLQLIKNHTSPLASVQYILGIRYTVIHSSLGHKKEPGNVRVRLVQLCGFKNPHGKYKIRPPLSENVGSIPSLTIVRSYDSMAKINFVTDWIIECTMVFSSYPQWYWSHSVNILGRYVACGIPLIIWCSRD